jgi:hypothetical protein
LFKEGEYGGARDKKGGGNREDKGRLMWSVWESCKGGLRVIERDFYRKKYTHTHIYIYIYIYVSPTYCLLHLRHDKDRTFL